MTKTLTDLDIQGSTNSTPDTDEVDMSRLELAMGKVVDGLQGRTVQGIGIAAPVDLCALLREA